MGSKEIQSVRFGGDIYVKRYQSIQLLYITNLFVIWFPCIDFTRKKGKFSTRMYVKGSYNYGRSLSSLIVQGTNKFTKICKLQVKHLQIQQRNENSNLRFIGPIILSV